MREVLLKIVDACPCDCAFCDSNENFRTRFEQKTFDLATWMRISDDLIANGLEVAIITGGDPLAKRKVALPLIKHLRAAGVFVTLNTSGAQFTSPSLLDALLDAYPDLLVFSIDSVDERQHDESRVRQGLFRLILSTLSTLKDAGDYPTGIRVVITNKNYTQLPEIIERFHDYGLDCMKFTHIENDRTGEYLLSRDQLRDFDTRIRPRILDALQRCSFETAELRSDAVGKFTGLLTETGGVTYDQLSKGVFAPDLTGSAGCDVVKRFSVIESNGQVLPCCESEHHYSPVLGNLITTPAAEVFSTRKYLRLFDNRQSYCTGCTEPHNMQITFRSRTLKVQQR
jgi:MoaA/NifB/PqqE/SkfB family radical SAM enzyme